MCKRKQINYLPYTFITLYNSLYCLAFKCNWVLLKHHGFKKKFNFDQYNSPGYLIIVIRCMFRLTGTEWPLISFTEPSALNRPILGPRIAAPTNPATPPSTCTRLAPEKSYRTMKSNMYTSCFILQHFIPNCCIYIHGVVCHLYTCSGLSFIYM